MTRKEFERKFPQSYLDELIEIAFQFLRKNKNLNLVLSHTSIKELYDCEDNTTECRVEVYYNNGHEIHNMGLIELLFTQDGVTTDTKNGADKITDLKTKIILRIAGRIGRHETGANYR